MRTCKAIYSRKPSTVLARLSPENRLVASGLKTEVLTKERQYMVLEAIGYSTGVSTGIDLEAVYDSIVIQYVMELRCVHSQPILIADVHGDAAILLQIPNVLIHESQRRVRRPLSEDVRLRRTIFHRQVKIQRRVLRIR